MPAKKQKIKAVPKRSVDPREAAIDAALRLAAKRDWDRITLKAIAAEARIGLADLSRIFESREDIVGGIVRRIDAEVLEAFPDGSTGSNPRERLFDIMMERYDRLNERRDAIISIVKSLSVNPRDILMICPVLGRSSEWMLESAGLGTTEWKGAARIMGLIAIHIYVLRVWKNDETADLSKTMAALDKALNTAETWAGRAHL